MKEKSDMLNSIGKKTNTILVASALAIGGMFAAGAASAQGNLYYMHNASAFYVWSDLSICESDLASSGNTCVSWGSSKCGRKVWATAATTNVARDKLGRNDAVVLRHTNGNSEFCRLEP
jgi:hypothetical protein